MSLSTMQEILILLEDEKFVPFYRLNRWGRSSRGALAKLINLGYTVKEKRENELYYVITTKGEKYFDDTLSVLRKSKWDKKWRLLMFDIPENNRALRDKLRRALSKMGMGILQGSVWISTEDIKNEVINIAEKLKLSKNIKFFEVTSTSGLDRQIVEKAWNLPEINLQLENFIKQATHDLKSIGKGSGDRFKAKKLIFEYALILKKDPKLPEEFVERNNLRQQADEIYQRLRGYAI